MVCSQLCYLCACIKRTSSATCNASGGRFLQRGSDGRMANRQVTDATSKLEHALDWSKSLSVVNMGLSARDGASIDSQVSDKDAAYCKTSTPDCNSPTTALGEVKVAVKTHDSSQLQDENGDCEK